MLYFSDAARFGTKISDTLSNQGLGEFAILKCIAIVFLLTAPFHGGSTWHSQIARRSSTWWAVCNSVSAAPTSAVIMTRNLSSLSGFVFVQIVIYFKLYSQDPQQIKALVRLYFISWLISPSTMSKVLAIWCERQMSRIEHTEIRFIR